MTTLATQLSVFLREHLPRDRGASSHTCETYAHTIKLLVCFAAERLRVKPSGLEIEQIDAPLILAFLEHIESERGNSARTRNARLAAIKSFCRFLEYRLPSAIEQCRQINAIPMKKADEALVAYLTRDELQALLDAPDLRSVSGVRDRAMLHVASAGGLRVSELVNLRIDVQVLRRVLPLLGHDPKEYDAQRVRDAVLEISRRYRRRRRATVHRQENGHPSRSAPHMRDAHPSSHRGCAQGFALARPCQHPEHRNLPSSRSDREA